MLNELDSTVTTYDFDDATGRMTLCDSASALPRSYVGNNRSSEIEINRDGRFLYASNRGHDSIVVFGVGADGALAVIGWEPSQGRTPHFFALDSDERYLYAANEDSDCIVQFRCNDGDLTPIGEIMPVGSPTTIVFRDMP
ncbi:beta-propeller fold lactonase family protein [Rhizobium sp. ZPR3]|uniref:Beta-propeller fold lactonase family protein n=2 Tax=unclassified Rhizobium TaxID=2613769 RepID=A0AAU7SQM9_9HYPH